MKRRVQASKEKRIIGSIRTLDIEKRIRKPSVRPGQTMKSKRAYNRKKRKAEERKTLRNHF